MICTRVRNPELYIYNILSTVYIISAMQTEGFPLVVVYVMMYDKYQKVAIQFCIHYLVASESYLTKNPCELSIEKFILSLN